MKYIVKFAGREPAEYYSENGYRQYAMDGLCEYILDGETGVVLYERSQFYVIIENGSIPDKRTRVFPTYDRAFRWAMSTTGINEFLITTVNPDEKGGD